MNHQIQYLYYIILLVGNKNYSIIHFKNMFKNMFKNILNNNSNSNSNINNVTYKKYKSSNSKTIQTSVFFG